VWWPVSLYEVTFKKRADPAKLVRIMVDDKPRKGIVLESKYGEPVGTVKMGKQWERKAKKVGTVVAGDQVFRKGQVEDAYSAACHAARTLDVAPGENNDNDMDGLSAKLVARKQKKRPAENDSSQSEDMDWFSAGPAAAPASRKSKAASSTKREREDEQQELEDDRTDRYSYCHCLLFMFNYIIIIVIYNLLFNLFRVARKLNIVWVFGIRYTVYGIRYRYTVYDIIRYTDGIRYYTDGYAVYG